MDLQPVLESKVRVSDLCSKQKFYVEEMSRFENMNLNEWSLFVRIFESQNIVENRTNMIKEFWNNRKTDFPRLAQVATYVS